MDDVLHNGPVPPLTEEEKAQQSGPMSDFEKRLEVLHHETAGDIPTQKSGGMISAFIDPETKNIRASMNFCGSGHELHRLVRTWLAAVNSFLVDTGTTYHYHLEVATTDPEELESAQAYKP